MNNVLRSPQGGYPTQVPLQLVGLYLVESAGGARFEKTGTIFYAVLIVAVTALIFYSFGTRSHMDVNILKDRNPLFVTLKDGSIRNGYTIKLLNKSLLPRSFEVSLDGAETARIRLAGENEDLEKSINTNSYTSAYVGCSGV